ncbi:DNA cytosine methyltransferase [Rubinisphaera sp.]|uniref:DNA cytosine methyltransferase n=1 Tax=Rubinisphaera sp. TaxID=2024857 RepID=UPI000C0E5A2E|nr:DNA cytosine methyltransferase [Rubinisphaera sp.]MBV09001.1 DNA (cytosine-5-)-methyltransferase [Rubinisphaera sp.]HCS53267.1 DNA (cytosine-5-)-methyltransferase [Planctomycetaceae bacterium]|tara:strand:- start:3102 stop:4127 length:1026 start_codon:yes stop_codon:yes gene_type:complete
MTNYNAVDVFAGCGGLSQGLVKAGFNVSGAIEIDPIAASTYQLNHKFVKVIEDDITKVDGAYLLDQIGKNKGDLDLLAGCPPCQGFSSLRTKNGGLKIQDQRNELIFEFQRLVEQIAPKTIMMENVPGLMHDQRLTSFLTFLKKRGYSVNCDILNTADFGVPQRRRRLILLASIYGKIEFADKAQKTTTVKRAIGKLKPAGHSGDFLHDFPEKRTPRVMEMIKMIPKDGGSRKQLPDSMQLQCHLNCKGFNDVFGRMAWDKVSPTITTGCFNPSKGRFLHPEEDRNITLREAALLQSFPKSYKFLRSSGKQQIARLIGNALPPEFIRRHASSIMSHLKSNN